MESASSQRFWAGRRAERREKAQTGKCDRAALSSRHTSAADLPRIYLSLLLRRQR
jgi:hypothetical protein